ncbi:hypothetical protein MCOR27_002417 [Pyricularia oryzae]|uniref:Arrestin C-terminal-like domain-containing protein n=3 Tax=Pyricularia TaxID=48558 RepID=A0ABQ8NJL8_PYRGI|nr:hypothetical protein MCOR01_002639 [Pyricularia oryzae]KAI6297987.1 hypothetical protein MCOR33_005776 [Pyricularia grisea]KAI6285049.1 hypothetical protein MCOR27_002417 [Pyricularia oryzae]KAI6320527.1 hypothetical protein MCOR29_005261 [Pyricularia oryzae]KAI6366182.1 hypothetical protein MCOR31_006649 [Pyricularia oryzae]
MSAERPRGYRRSRTEPFCRTAHGAIYFTPRDQSDRRSIAAAPVTLPPPLIGPRPRRPHSIHIVSYPAGFIPRELRPISAEELARRELAASGRWKGRKRKQKQNDNVDRKRVHFQLEDGAATRLFQKVLSVFSTPKAPPRPPTPPILHSEVVQRPEEGRARRPVDWLADGRLGRRFSRIADGFQGDESVDFNMVDQMVRPPMMDLRRGVGYANNSNRHSILSTRSAKTVMSSAVTEVPKPVASASGLSCSILLAEQNVFLSGFEHEGHNRESSTPGTALLRGKLVLNVNKNTKLKSITLKLVGKARTEWPEGIPPLKVDTFEEQSLRTQGLTFFHAMHDGWETEFGNQCVFTMKTPTNQTHGHILERLSPNGSNTSVNTLARHRQSTSLTPKELKRLSLQSVQSRSFGKGESPLANQTQLKGYKVFTPGTYEYSFELPIDHHQLETIKLQYGSVKWNLETVIERAGAFRANLSGSKEVSIVRVPDQLSLEMSEPISISRQWEDQLHYDIMISGKSFPIGGKIPIAFKLTPLAKVQVHKIKVFVTESIEYWTNDKRVTRKDQGRKILLLEKTAGKGIDPQYATSEINVVRGGELTDEERIYARAAAERRRAMDAARSHTMPEPLPESTENLLGDLDLGLESYWAATEMEMNVQIPTCEMMARDRSRRLHPDCSWKNVNVFHWIKIVMRISRLDPEDPTGKRRRHFEISIDSPFTVLNCRATQANTSLPQYSGSQLSQYCQATTCGCPDAAVIATEPSPASSTGTLPVVEVNPDSPTAPSLPATPPAAHLAAANPGIGRSDSSGSGSSSFRPASSMIANPLQRVRNNELPTARPMHLMRVPSFNPPPFDADQPPPALDGLSTPPPNYDLIIGTPSVDGLADYFARLANYEDREAGRSDSEDDEDDEEAHTPARLTERGGRVNVANPRTPGGRNVPSRSFDIQRPVMNLSMDGVVARGQQRV